MGRIILTDHRGHPAPAAPSAPARRAAGSGIGFASGSPVRVSVDKLDTHENRQLTGQAWRDVVHKTAAMEANVPYVDGAIGSVADYLGPVTPDPATSDEEYNREVRAWLEWSLLESYDFDATGKFLFADLQKQMWKYHDRDGDCLAVDTFEEAGNRRSRPVVRLFPALAVDSPRMAGMSSEWVDGVRVGLHHRHQAYHVLWEESQINYRYVSNRDGYEVPRASAHLFGNFSGIGGTRGRTRFLASGNTIIDLAMMDSATHRLFDLASKFGISFTSQPGAPGNMIKTLDGLNETEILTSESVTDADGAGVDVETVREKLVSEGSVILDLTGDAGTKMEIAKVSDALPDVTAVRGSDLERIAMSYRLPVQILFCIMSGAFNLTGPGFRMTLARAARWRESHLKKIEPWVKRQYSRHIAWGLATGQIPQPKKSVLRPFLCRTRFEADVGIDESRDVKSDMLRLQMGATTEAEIAAKYGRSIKDVIDERTDFIQQVLNKLGYNAVYWGDNFQPNRPAAPGQDGQDAAAAA